jgi:hypothetical protein
MANPAPNTWLSCTCWKKAGSLKATKTLSSLLAMREYCAGGRAGSRQG